MLKLIKRIFDINEVCEKNKVVEPWFRVLPEDYDIKEYKIKRKDDVKIYELKRAKDRGLEDFSEFEKCFENNKPI